MCSLRMEHGRRYKTWSERSAGAKAGVIAAVAVAIPGLLALCGLVTMWLWNALMPELFKLPAIGLWQALGLLALSRILLKGTSPWRHARGHWRRREVWKHLHADEVERPEQA
jgi:hypothetical protein